MQKLPNTRKLKSDIKALDKQLYEILNRAEALSEFVSADQVVDAYQEAHYNLERLVGLVETAEHVRTQRRKIAQH